MPLYTPDKLTTCSLTRLTLLPELRLALLDCSHNHVAYTSSWQSVQTSLNPFHRDNVEVLGTYRGNKKKPFALANPLQKSLETFVTPLIEVNSTGCHFTQKRCLSIPFHDNSLSH